MQVIIVARRAKRATTYPVRVPALRQLPETAIATTQLIGARAAIQKIRTKGSKQRAEWPAVLIKMFQTAQLQLQCFLLSVCSASLASIWPKVDTANHPDSFLTVWSTIIKIPALFVSKSGRSRWIKNPVRIQLNRPKSIQTALILWSQIRRCVLPVSPDLSWLEGSVRHVKFTLGKRDACGVTRMTKTFV